MTGAHKIARPELVASILARPEPIVVLEAPFGMGKSEVLADLAGATGARVHRGASAPPDGKGLRLWDMETSVFGEALDGLNGTDGKLVLAKRPEATVAGLERAIAYGRAAVLRAPDLIFTATELARAFRTRRAAELLRQTGGWPVAFGPGLDSLDAHRLTRLFRAEFVRHLDARSLVWLDGCLAGTDLSRPPADFEGLVTLPSRDLFAGLALRGPLARAVSGEIRHRLAQADLRPGCVAAYRSAGRAPEAIAALQEAGETGAALALLTAEQGFFCYFRYGPEAFDRMLASFDREAVETDEALFICFCLQSLKHGDVARTRQVVSDRFGAGALDPLAVFSDKASYSLPFRLFRVVLLIYEDVFVSEEHLEQMFRLIGEMPVDDHYERGSFYNSVLEIHIRSRRFAEAEEVAQRALFHYAAADLPMLQFYIRLHQAVIRLMEGDSRGAQKLAVAARADLGRCGFESPNDLRLLTLLTACADYEAGNAGPLARFLSDDYDEFSHAELWPTVVELAVHYGAQALSEHFSTFAALGFLDRWRVHQVQNRQFQTLLGLREAAILQNGHRWQEAGDVLAGIMPGCDRNWALSPATGFARLEERDMVTLALAWLRQIVFEAPQREGLGEQLLAIRSNLHLTGRQRLSVDLWRAHVLRHQRNHAQTCRILERLLDSAGRLGAVAVLAEQGYFLDDLLGQKRIEANLTLSEPATQILRRLKNLGISAEMPGAGGTLTRRETRMLKMIGDGNSNKFIAKSLGISESTVKFHLKNLYAKLECHRRRDAIEKARQIGLLG
jgi:DNA-binding CsgD family transcriptional regulator